MKKYAKLLSILFVAVGLFFLSGCANFEYRLTVNEDGSADVEYRYAVNALLLSFIDQTNPSAAAREAARQEGYETADYSAEDMKGFVAKKHFGSVQDITLEPLNVLTNGKLGTTLDIALSKGFLSRQYSLKTTIDLSYMKQTGENAEFINSILKEIKFKCIINLPIAAAENNATKVSADGKMLEWTMLAGEISEISFAAEAQNRDNYLIVLIGGGILVFVIVLTVLLILFRAKKRRSSGAADIESKKENAQKRTSAEINKEKPAKKEKVKKGKPPLKSVVNKIKHPKKAKKQESGDTPKEGEL